MSVKLVPAAFALASLLGGLGGVGIPNAQASGPDQAQACVFDRFAPVAVSPYSSENSMGWGSYGWLGGAQLFVPASEGLTKEWLTVSVQQAIDSAQLCDSPRVTDVHVNVVSGGNGFWVQLIGQDEDTSAALLRWARSVVERHPGTAAR